MTTPQLKKEITLIPMVLFGVAYITPFIVLTTFGAFSEISQGTLASSYLLTTIAMIFTAISYGKLAREIPSSGSAYTYIKEVMEPRTGFMVGWAIMLDYFFLPMVVWLIGTAYLTAHFPDIPAWVFLLLFISITTTINIIGIKVATHLNIILISFQLLVLAAFLYLSIKRIASTEELGFTLAPFWNEYSTFGAILGGAAVAAYSFIGFDAVSTFSEEAVDPRKTVPRAIILTAGIAGSIFVLVAFVVQLVHPSFLFENADSAALTIAKQIGGDLFSSVFLATVVIAQFTAGIPIQAAGTRMMYAMGRDGVIPKKFFGYISPRFGTPVNNLILTGLIGFIALFLTIESSTSFINFGAFTAFAFVNISVIILYFKQKHTERRTVISWIVQPLIGFSVIMWLMTNLDKHALVVGSIWLLVGFLWLVYITKGFKSAPPTSED